MINNNFIKRHNGPTDADAERMLKVIGVESEEKLVGEIISDEIRLPKPLDLGTGINEYECVAKLKAIGARNKQFRTYIGLGYYNTITPGVIMRNILENPGWYTSYTPYQAEISQGRLEALLNFQTVISDLTAMPLANASLLDEATAAAEAMLMFWHSRSRAQVKAGVHKFFVADDVFPQTIEVVKTRAHFLGIDVVIGNVADFAATDDFFGMMDDGEGRNSAGRVDLGIGRLPVSTPEEANAILRKIRHYHDLSSIYGEWKTNHLLLAGDDANHGYIGTIETNSIPITDTILHDMNLVKIYADAYPTVNTPSGQQKPQAHDELMRAYDEKLFRRRHTIEERKYAQLSPEDKLLFADARTVTPGKTKFKISIPEDQRDVGSVNL